MTISDAVSTVSSLGCHQNTQQYLAAAAAQAATPQYSTVQKILIPGSKVRSMLCSQFCTLNSLIKLGHTVHPEGLFLGEDSFRAVILVIGKEEI